jgi:hypothetical protein
MIMQKLKYFCFKIKNIKISSKNDLDNIKFTKKVRLPSKNWICHQLIALRSISKVKKRLSCSTCLMRQAILKFALVIFGGTHLVVLP